MRSVYSYNEMEALLGKHGFLIYEELDGENAERELFKMYNITNPSHNMHAPKGVRYCLAVKKTM